MCSDILYFSLWKEKIRLIRKWFDGMLSSSYSFGMTSLTTSLLEEFYPFYMSYISTKPNARITNLIEYYNHRLLIDDLYFSFVRDSSWQLLAGCIIVNKMIQGKQTLMLSFRASLPDVSFQKLRLGYYLEYLFFDLGLSLWVAQYSRWRDRNGYGLFGSDIGVCIHKLQLHFSPYVANKSIEILIEESKIKKSSLFLVNAENSWKLASMILYLDPKEKTSSKNVDLISLAQKRWFSIDIREIL
jgi:hypothetical protein